MPEYPYPLVKELMPFWYVMAFILGTCIGSFLNVVIYRVPEGISLSNPNSHCPKCKHDIRWYENIPLVSWLALRAKCSGCGCKIPARYFLIELLTGILFLLLFAKIIYFHEPAANILLYFGVTMLVISTFFIDLEHQIIPDKTTYPAMIFGLAVALVFPAAWYTKSHWSSLLQSTLCMLGSGGVLALFAIIGSRIFQRDALGWGDVKYIAAIGACLGWRAAYFSLLFGSITGAAAGITLMCMKRKNFKGAISFGPFLAAGTYLWMLLDVHIMLLYKVIFNIFH